MAHGLRRIIRIATVTSCIVGAVHGHSSTTTFEEPNGSGATFQSSLVPFSGGQPDDPAPAATPPVSPVRVTRGFEPPKTAYAPGHRGVDLAAAPGAAVFSALAGTVTFAGPVAGSDVVSVQIAAGQRLTYEPITPVVARGQAVTKGQLLGHLETGHAGCPVAACLHWGWIDGATYADPLALLAADQVRLLPWNETSPAANLGGS
jgi:murein DD-endopeptidase MepM/ murein hydrolase activator NlpD